MAHIYGARWGTTGHHGPYIGDNVPGLHVLEPIISTILFSVIGNCHLQKSSWDNVQKLSSRCPDTTHTEDNLSVGGRGVGVGSPGSCGDRVRCSCLQNGHAVLSF